MYFFKPSTSSGNISPLSANTTLPSRPSAETLSTTTTGSPAGMLTPEVARRLPKPVGLPVVVVLKVSADGRDGKVVFAESGEMFPEDVEGLKKYL